MRCPPGHSYFEKYETCSHSQNPPVISGTLRSLSQMLASLSESCRSLKFASLALFTFSIRHLQIQSNDPSEYYWHCSFLNRNGSLDGFSGFDKLSKWLR